MRICKVDNNQKEIVDYLRSNGAIVKHLHTVKNLFDIIVFYDGKIFCMELKSSYKSKLTKGEIKCKQELESVGVKYHIVYNKEQALNIIKQ